MTGAALGVDVVTKQAARSALDDAIVLGPLKLHLGENTGVAFGAAGGIPPWMIVAITAGISVVLAVLAFRASLHTIGAGLIVGGALGNVIDRIDGGSVTDFMDLGWWPAFNLADVVLVAGVGLVVLVAGGSERFDAR